MANRAKDSREKKTVPVNILLTEDANLELSKFALQVSTATARVTKSDIVRATLEAGLPLFDLVRQLTSEVPFSHLPEFLKQKPIIETVTQLAQEHAGPIRARGAVRTRGGVRVRGGVEDVGQAFAAPAAGLGPGIALVSPVNTGVHQAPTFAWRLPVELITAHLRARTTAPIRCSVRVLDDEQEVWGEIVEVALPREAQPEQEAQVVRSVAMPPEVFTQLSTLTWKPWTVQAVYGARASQQTREATALFLKVASAQAAQAAVEGFLGQGRAYEAQGLLEESTAFFRQALETSCQQLATLYRRRGLPQAEAYQRLLEDIGRLRS